MPIENINIETQVQSAITRAALQALITGSAVKKKIYHITDALGGTATIGVWSRSTNQVSYNAFNLNTGKFGMYFIAFDVFNPIIEGDSAVMSYVNNTYFPAVGNYNAVYLDLSTGIAYAWNGTSYFALSGGTVYEPNVIDFPAIGDTDTLYVATDTGVMYLWDGAAYQPLNNSQDIPLAGTLPGSPVTGDIEIEANIIHKIYSNDGFGNIKEIIFSDDPTWDFKYTDGATGYYYKLGFQGGRPYLVSDDPNFDLNPQLSAISTIVDTKARIWTKAGTPTTSDDVSEGYLVGSLIWDTANSIMYKCTDNTNSAAVWAVATISGASSLQDTTDVGNTTTNDIELIDAAEVKFGAGGGVLLDNASRLREGTIDAGTGGSKGIAQICGVGYELKWEAGSQYAMNGSGDAIRVVNYKFNIVPSATDDSSSGFYVGSRWILDDGVSYICTDSTIGAAVWEVEVLPYIPLAGTDGTNLVTGSIVVDPSVANWAVSETNGGLLHEVGWEAGVLAFLRTSQGANIGQVVVRENTVESTVSDGTSTSNFSLSAEIAGMASSNGTESTFIQVSPTGGIVNSNDVTFEGLKYNDNFDANFTPRSLIDQEVMRSRIWTKAGTPTTTDDFSLGYLVGSLIWDTTNSILYRCTDNTGSAAVWTVAFAGGGDMLKSVYDTDDDGIVDKAETVQIIVRNSTGSTLTKGQVVYLSGATGNRPNAVLAQANSEATSSKTIGVVVANIANNSDGNIAVSGTLHDLNTNSFAAGDAVWLSATTAGAITVTPPAEPNHTVFIGYIARAHPTQGRIVIAIQNGYELNELHGVSVPSPSDNQVLAYNSTSGLWENKTPSPPIYLELIRTGSVIPASATRFAAEGLTGITTSVVATIAPKRLFTTFRVLITTAQPASGSLVISRKFYNVAGVEIGSQNLTIPSSSVAGIYEYTSASFDMSATNGSYGFTIVNNATSSSGNLNSIESVYQ